MIRLTMHAVTQAETFIVVFVDVFQRISSTHQRLHFVVFQFFSAAAFRFYNATQIIVHVHQIHDGQTFSACSDFDVVFVFSFLYSWFFARKRNGKSRFGFLQNDFFENSQRNDAFFELNLLTGFVNNIYKFVGQDRAKF